MKLSELTTDEMHILRLTVSDDKAWYAKTLNNTEYQLHPTEMVVIQAYRYGFSAGIAVRDEEMNSCYKRMERISILARQGLDGINYLTQTKSEEE